MVILPIFYEFQFPKLGCCLSKKIIKLRRYLGDSANHVFITDKSNKTTPGLCKCNVSDLVENGSLTNTDGERNCNEYICQCLPFNLLSFHIID